MNGHRASEPCVHQDAVLAHLLDGDTASPELAGFLADHLAACPRCVRVLSSARRLDSVVALVSGVEVGQAAAERALTEALAEAKQREAIELELSSLPIPSGREPRAVPSLVRRRLSQAVAVVVLLASGFALARLWHGSAPGPAQFPAQFPVSGQQDIKRSSGTSAPLDQPETEAPDGDMASASTQTTDFVLRPHEILLPELGPSDSNRSRADRPAPFLRPYLPPMAGASATMDSGMAIALLTQADFTAPLSYSLALRARMLGLEAPSAAAARAPDLVAPLQQRAFDSLLEGAVLNSENAFQAICRHLAECPVSHTRLLPDQTVHATFLRTLARRLTDGPRPYHVAAAARITDPIVVKALRRQVDGREDRLDMVVASWRGLDDASPHMATLLDLWTDLRRRRGGTDHDDVARTQRFVAPLHGPLGATLARLGMATVHAERRRLVFLCLAACPDPVAMPWLVTVMQGSRLEERLLAAYALGSLSPEAVRTHLLQAPPRPRERSLWTAVLLRAGDPVMRQALNQWSLSPEERDWLLRGVFPPDQMATVVALCESRPTTPL